MRKLAILVIALALCGCAGRVATVESAPEHRYESIDDGIPNIERHPDIVLTPVWPTPGAVYW